MLLIQIVNSMKLENDNIKIKKHISNEVETISNVHKMQSLIIEIQSTVRERMLSNPKNNQYDMEKLEKLNHDFFRLMNLLQGNLLNKTEDLYILNNTFTPYYDYALNIIDKHKNGKPFHKLTTSLRRLNIYKKVQLDYLSKIFSKYKQSILNEINQIQTQSRIFNIVYGIIDILGVLLIACIALYNINKEKEAEQIKKSNQISKQKLDYLGSILDNLPIGIIVISNSGVAMSENESSRKILEIASSSTLIGEDMYIYLEKLEPQLINILYYTIKTSRNRKLSDIKYKNPYTKEIKILDMTFTPIVNNVNSVTTGVVLSILDQTNSIMAKELEKALEETKKAKKTAEEANKLKSQFLANISHELRTPLNNIIGYSEEFLPQNIKQYLNPKTNVSNLEEIESYILSEFGSYIYNSGKHLLRMINDLIDYSRIETDSFKLVYTLFNINTILVEIKNMFEEQIKNKNLDFILEIEPEINTIYSDKERIIQILGQLISNAIKFTEQGYIKLAVSKDKDKIKFSVSDSGIGMDKEKTAIIFNSFTQIDGTDSRKFGGTGLGLAMSKRLVELLSGNLYVESRLHSGSMFYFTLPLEKESEEAKKEENYYGRKTAN